jgi:hypothetical protein
VSWGRQLLSRAVVGSEPKRVLVAVAAGTEPLEAAAPADILERAGARVTVATVGDIVVEAAHGVRFVADGRVADLEGEEFDLIVLPVRVLITSSHAQFTFTVLHRCIIILYIL